MFLVEQLRTDGQLPPAGTLATPLTTAVEPTIALSNGQRVPQLAFGMYQVPVSEEGTKIVAAAVQSGYRHFDTATVYGNEAMLGKALKATGIPRNQFFITTKVWNDAVKQGRAAVRASVEQSIVNLDWGAIDLVLIHWPVPGHFVDAYRELELLVQEGKLKAIGLSNFGPREYEELVAAGISVLPVVNQTEINPAMNRPDLIEYFQERNIAVAASKALSRGSVLSAKPVQDIAKRYSVTPAQVVLRWSLQKGLIVVAKTSNATRMQENRSIFRFRLSDEDERSLDLLTFESAVQKREALEAERKRSL